MNGPHRVALGLLLFVLAAWMSPFIADAEILFEARRLKHDKSDK